MVSELGILLPEAAIKNQKQVFERLKFALRRPAHSGALSQQFTKNNQPHSESEKQQFTQSTQPEPVSVDKSKTSEPIQISNEVTQLQTSKVSSIINANDKQDVINFQSKIEKQKISTRS